MKERAWLEEFGVQKCQKAILLPLLVCLSKSKRLLLFDTNASLNASEQENKILSASCFPESCQFY